MLVLNQAYTICPSMEALLISVCAYKYYELVDFVLCTA